jgi:ABC-type multidrug transport system fused ATPase/permease subunit
LVHALLGLVRAQSGTIEFGGHDIRAVPPATWRLRVGYVPQETMLFHASVRENISLARPDASLEEVTAAAKRAHAHEFIMRLPKHYDTEIGDQGVLLSGGQRQRLGIARALLPNPILLLMDEPTSSLDSESEQEILSTLDELRKTVGIIIVAHRLSTIRNADRIYVMDAGRIIEQGEWDALIGQRKQFHTLARTQQLVG